MVIGIGTDMVELKRIEKACGRQAFLSRIYTEEERRQAGESISRLAGDFAVKEAVVKCFGTGFVTVRPADIEALRDEKGKPYVNLYGEAEKQAEALGIDRLHVSITNTGGYALAFCVAERKDESL